MERLQAKYKTFKTHFKNSRRSQRDTGSSLSVSGRDCVLYNPELLENIMMYLPERHLLAYAQRVSRLWHSLVNLSPTLQQKLYFQPITPSNSNGHAINSVVNPILDELFAPWFRSFGRNTLSTSITLFDFRNMDWNSSLLKREAYRRKEASWRRMLVAQPPVLDVSRRSRCDINGGFHGGPMRPREYWDRTATILEGKSSRV